MKQVRIPPGLIVVLAVVLVFAAACDRPEPQQVLDTPQPLTGPQQVTTPGTGVSEQTVPENATPTLPAPSGETNLGVATAAPGGEQALPTVAAPQPTAEAPAQPTPQPVQPAQPTQPATAQPQPTPAPGGNQVYTVKLGDTLFSIGRLYNVNPYTIAAASNIPYPYVIYPGQQLTIPTGGTMPPGPYPAPVPPGPGGCRYRHLVRLGENLFRISLAYGVPMSTIAAANGIYNYNLIYAGQTLCIP